jgi:RNA polymerase sigma-70 factor (ECF subfamily)
MHIKAEPAISRYIPAEGQQEHVMSEFGRLLELEIPALRRYARKLTRDTTQADDLVQSCLERALVKEKLWQPGSDLRRWLFTMLYHQRISALRREARERTRLAEAAHALSSAAPSDPAAQLFVHEVAQAIAVLPDGQRQAIRRVALDGMDYAEAARLLAVPPGTMRSRLARGRAALRKLVEDGAEAAEIVPFHRPAVAHADASGGRLAA